MQRKGERRMVQYISDKSIEAVISELEKSGKEVVVIITSGSTPIPATKSKSIWKSEPKSAPASPKLIDKGGDINKTISNILKELGMTANLLGYDYVRAAIKMVCMDVNTIHSVTKTIYPALADMYDTTSSKAERGIRHAIKAVWTRGNVNAMTELFGYTVDPNKGKPSNSEFIAMIADYITLNSAK